MQLEVNQSLVENGVGIPPDATPLRVAAGLYEVEVVAERRKRREDCDSRQQMQKAREE